MGAVQRAYEKGPTSRVAQVATMSDLLPWFGQSGTDDG